MQLRSILLYGKQGQLRRLDFPLGSLCVVTGASKTGKSALIEVVDYCLGRESCTIPVGVIRDSVSWFAVLLQLSEIQYFVARQTPEDGQQYQSEIYVKSAAAVEVPSFEQLIPNSNINALEAQLTEFLGIAPNLNVSATEQASPNSFLINARHTTFFIFQQQDEIASRKLLFHREGDEFIPHTIRQTLPYFIGAAAEDRLIKVHELDRLKVECDEIGRRIQEYERSVGNIDRALDLLREARQVGLSDRTDDPTDRSGIDATLAAAVREPLREVPAIVDDDRDRLQRERAALMRRYRDLKEEVRAAEEFEREQLGYQQEMNLQVGRLRSIELFPIDSAADICPVCFSRPQNPTPSQIELRDLLEAFRRKLGPIQRQVTNVREHIVRMYKDLSALRQDLQRNWTALSAATAASRAFAEQENNYRRQSYVTGRITLYLQSRQEIFGGEPLEEIFLQKKKRIQELEDELNNAEVAEKQNSILNAVGSQMSEWGKELNLEFSSSPLRIDIRKLNVVADTSKGPISLDKMGGGENWVGYHLVAFSALHSHFVTENRPIPRFLMLDQPSQVYFPQDRPNRNESLPPDEDELAVLRMFTFLKQVVDRLNGNFQIIVMDHADLHDQFFKEAVVQRWRNGKALIPIEWIGGSAELLAKDPS